MNPLLLADENTSHLAVPALSRCSFLPHFEAPYLTEFCNLISWHILGLPVNRTAPATRSPNHEKMRMYDPAPFLEAAGDGIRCIVWSDYRLSGNPVTEWSYRAGALAAQLKRQQDYSSLASQSNQSGWLSHDAQCHCRVDGFHHHSKPVSHDPLSMNRSGKSLTHMLV